MKMGPSEGFEISAPRVSAGRRQMQHSTGDDLAGDQRSFAELLEGRVEGDGAKPVTKEPVAAHQSIATSREMNAASLQLATLIAQAPAHRKRGDLHDARAGEDHKPPGSHSGEKATAKESVTADQPMPGGLQAIAGSLQLASLISQAPGSSEHRERCDSSVDQSETLAAPEKNAASRSSPQDVAAPIAPDAKSAAHRDDDMPASQAEGCEARNRDHGGEAAKSLASAVVLAASPGVARDTAEDKPIKPTVTAVSIETHLAAPSPSLSLLSRLEAANDVAEPTAPTPAPAVMSQQDLPIHKPVQILKVQFEHEATGSLSATLKLRHNLIAVQFDAKDETTAVGLRNDAAKLELELKSAGYAIDGVTVQTTRSDATRNDSNNNTPPRQPMDSGGQSGFQERGQSSTSASAGDDTARQQTRRKQEQKGNGHEENRRVSHPRSGGVYL